MNTSDEWCGAALLAGLLGAGCTAATVAAQTEPASLNWPLLLVPAAAVPLVFVRRRLVPMAGAVAMAVWCSLSSIGIFLLPCALLMIGAARRGDA